MGADAAVAAPGADCKTVLEAVAEVLEDSGSVGAVQAVCNGFEAGVGGTEGAACF